MMSLFSNFDLFFFNFQYFFYACFLVLFFCSTMKVSFISSSLNIVNFSMSNFFSTLKPKSFTNLIFCFLISVMVLIFNLNFLSVLPFNFAFTSQTSMVVFISFSIWISFFIFQIMKNFKGFMSHCIPEGTPIYLTWFLFLIEIVSNSIRPVTLGVRLVANILAGHLLMILLSQLALKFSIVIPMYGLLNLVEIFVAMIQSYIFVTMITLYFSDVN